jgi:mono/diheme cytochrome c family protein
MKNILIISLLLSNWLFSQEFELDLEMGKEIYNTTCISCHGADGKAQTNMNLVVKPRDLTKTILDQKQIFEVIKHGAIAYGSKSDIMPSFKYVYNDEQLTNLAYYVYETFSKTQQNHFKTLITQAIIKINDKEVSLSLGEKIFKKNCKLCHGIVGDGNSKYVENSKHDDKFIYPYNLQKILLSEDQIFMYAKLGGKYWGTHKDDMPSWETKYCDNELKSVAKYINEKR